VSTTQLVLATALGFILGQGVLFGIRHMLAWVRRAGIVGQFRPFDSLRGSALIGGFVKYAGVLAAAAAVITIFAWTIGDYLRARAAQTAASDAAPEPGVVLAETHDAPPEPERPPLTPIVRPAPDSVDPYADPDFKVHRTTHHAGKRANLQDALVQRSEAKAGLELLKQTQQQARRSQYDCEAAERAARYLKAKLDVWGFPAWQTKYFPKERYKGATLPQCRDIKDVLDPTGVDLQSAVADSDVQR
jgi:hypothetical protein